MTNTRYYYLRDVAENRPIVTICLLEDEAGNIGRGVSIYNNTDFATGQFPLNKAIGKHKALGQARKALGTSSTSNPIHKEQTLRFLGSMLGPKVKELGPLFKSQYNPELTTYEKKLLNK